MLKTWPTVAFLCLITTGAPEAQETAQGDYQRTLAAWDCNSAVDEYNSALGEIESYVRRYVNCVNSSRGYDDCSSEFRRLRNAQSDFESAVSNYGACCQ